MEGLPSGWARHAGVPGFSLKQFFAARVRVLLYLQLPIPLLAVVSCPSSVTRFQKPWAANLQVSSSPGGEAELQTP